ncbi:HEAT repeat domain-containing protein, partial [Roseisolibacter sp. H3M3-2]|uniref:HEAT repeat domain-containing protein n=1 Tax=Roseisolibacter sp. H3M3-2 TaxID=3031323 RepID=UPI0023DBF019
MPAATRDFLNSLGRLATLLGDAAPDAEGVRVEMHRLGRLSAERRVDLWLRDVADADSPLMARLRREGVVRLVIRRGASARELAQFAGLFARDAGDGATVLAGLDALGIWGVQPLVDASGGAGAPADVPEVGAAVAGILEARRDDLVTPAWDALRDALALVPSRLPDETQSAVAVALAFADLAARLGAARDSVASDLVAAHRAEFDRLLDPHLTTIVHAVAARPLPDAHPVLRHAADRLVPLLLDRLGEAEGIDERRRCFVALLDAGGGVDTLIEALRDPRWYVVRNVALVLGELGARSAVRPLARCLTAAHRRARAAAAQ